MKKNGNRKRDARLMRQATNSEPSVKIAFHSLVQNTLATGAAAIGFSADAFGPRGVALADAYNFYRIEELKYRLIPGAALTGTQVAAFYPGVIDSAPNTNSANSESLHAVVLGSKQTTPTGWMTLSPAATMSYFPWLKTKAGSLDPSEEQQGNFYITGSGSDVYVIEYAGIVAFRSPVATGSTPMAREAHARAEKLAMKKKLLELITYSEKEEVTDVKLASRCLTSV